VIYVSDPFPGTAFGYTHRLNPELAAKITAAFLSYDWKDPPLNRELPEVTRFVPTSYKDEFEIIRKIDTASGVTYDCK
jgi:phosphonate transport system substrate-binding protein